jgi:hypothetical protein
MMRGHRSSTFPLEEEELKDGMRKNEGIHAGIAPEEEVSRNGAAGAVRGAGLLNSASCPNCLQSGDFSSGCSFLLVHRRVSPSHKLIHPLAGSVRSQSDGGIDA